MSSKPVGVKKSQDVDFTILTGHGDLIHACRQTPKSFKIDRQWVKTKNEWVPCFWGSQYIPFDYVIAIDVTIEQLDAYRSLQHIEFVQKRNKWEEYKKAIEPYEKMYQDQCFDIQRDTQEEISKLLGI